jgi:hypothetical protein
MSTVSAHGPVSVEKRAVCWLDVLIFVIFVTLCLWWWSLADRLITDEYRPLEPVKETYEHQARVPYLLAGFTTAQEELKLLQSKLFELRTEAMRLAVEISILGQNPRAKLLSSQRERQMKLQATQTMLGKYEAEMPGKMNQVAKAATDLFSAKRSAELAHDKAVKAFGFVSKIRGLLVGVIGWVILALVTGGACIMLRKFFGHGHALHVLLPGGVLVALSCIYYVVK